MPTKRAWRLLLLLIVMTTVLSGCGVKWDENDQAVVPSPFNLISEPLEWAVTTVSNLLAGLGLTQTIGLAIILVTILIRLLLYPLTRKQMDSMRKMQEIQPQMKELQEKYGKDREKFAQKQMELYQQAGVNPAMGCLPLLLQMPILLGFYYGLIALGPALEQAFLWIPNLAFPEYARPDAPAGTGGLSWLQPISIEHFTSPEVWPYLILPVIYILTQLIIQRMSQASNPTTASGSMGTMMMLMPIFFGYITLILPSGLSLYWVTSNIIQIVQQGFSTGWSGILPERGKAEEASGKAVKAGKPAQVGAVGSGDAMPASSSGPSAGRRRKMRKKKR